MEVQKEDVCVIFLDIDGVVIDPNKYHLQQDRKEIVKLFDTETMKHLDKLIEEIPKIKKCPVHIVLSSNWRLIGQIEYLKWLFGAYNFSKYIMDKTPYIGMYLRNLEIMAWLQATQYNIVDFVVFDDCDLDLRKTFGYRFILCDEVLLLKEPEYKLAVTALKINQQFIMPKEKDDGDVVL